MQIRRQGWIGALCVSAATKLDGGGSCPRCGSSPALRLPRVARLGLGLEHAGEREWRMGSLTVGSVRAGDGRRWLCDGGRRLRRRCSRGRGVGVANSRPELVGTSRGVPLNKSVEAREVGDGSAVGDRTAEGLTAGGARGQGLRGRGECLEPTGRCGGVPASERAAVRRSEKAHRRRIRTVTSQTDGGAAAGCELDEARGRN